MKEFMPKQLVKTILGVVAAVAVEAADNAHLLPVSEKNRAIVVLASRGLVAGLAFFNLYRNPDASPASAPYEVK